MGDELKNQLIDLVAGLGEAIIDQGLADGVFKDIPIVGTFVQLARLSATIPNQIFMAKVARFLSALPPIPQDDRLRFAERIAADEKEREKTGQALVMILDRLDSLDKVEILAFLYASMLKNRLTSAQFRRLASAVDLGFVDDLEYLMQHTGGGSADDQEHMAALTRTGLVELNPRGSPASTGFGEQVVFHRLRVTPLGTLFREMMRETRTS